MLSIDRWQTKTVMTLSALLSLDLHLPAFQREIDEEHVNEIVVFQNEAFNKYDSFLFVGDLILAKTDDNQTSVIDGNHRIHCIKKIYLKQPSAQIGVTTILIDGTGPTLLEVFSLINKSKPVPDYIITRTCEHLTANAVGWAVIIARCKGQHNHRHCAIAHCAGRDTNTSKQFLPARHRVAYLL